MAKKDRTGNRKTRDQRKVRRIPEMGYYLVVTDTEATERSYFNGLHDTLPDSVKKKLVIKVVETKTKHWIQKCMELTAYDAQYRIPWIVFDRDRVPNFDEIIRDAKEANVHVAWSNPCFEIWMFSYFGTMPSIKDSWTCCKRFGEVYKKRTGKEYSKANKELYKDLIKNGDEEKAIDIAFRKYNQCLESGYSIPSEMYPCTTAYELVQEIRNRIN